MDNLSNYLLVIYRVGLKIIHVAILNGIDCANGITIKPLNIKTVLMSLDRRKFVRVRVFNFVFAPLGGAIKEC